MNIREKAEQAIMYLERMAEGKFPLSDTMADMNSDLNHSEIVRGLFFCRDVMKEILDENRPQSYRKRNYEFPLDCLKNFSYEKDKTIMNFVAQLKQLSGNPDTKGISAKRITDWLKEKSYLQEVKDSITGDKATIITELGEKIGLYEEMRKTRFGQEYKVIQYPEKTQKWIVENLPLILNTHK